MMHYSSRKYRMLVEWIALNEDAIETDPQVIAGSLTVTMLAHCFDLKNADVASDVLEIRARELNP